MKTASITLTEDDKGNIAIRVIHPIEPHCTITTIINAAAQGVKESVEEYYGIKCPTEIIQSENN